MIDSESWKHRVFLELYLLSEVTTMESVLGVAIVGLCLELQQQRVHSELHQRGISAMIRSCSYYITHV
jgi:hypothetical protein